MKKIKYTIAAVSLALLATSCDTFLDTENLTQKSSANYPRTVVEAKQVLTGMYNPLNLQQADPQFSFLYVAELASDDRLGGGGTNDLSMQAHDLLMNNGANQFRPFWATNYKGIHRANFAIETLANCEGYESDDQKKQMLGEAYFMRAYYYYELASMFENIPLTLNTAVVELPLSSPDQTWAQIISDFKMAATLMPAKKFGTNWVESGHADKWSAQGFLARAFLFYTGFYNKTEVVLADGSKITKADVIAQIDDCVNNSGYTLVSDFRNLWAYTNKLTKEDYTYTKGLGLKCVEDDNAVNPEAMFSIKFSQFADWGTTIGYSNGIALHMGIRGSQDYAKTFPFGSGWGAGPVAPNLWADWKAAEPNDTRRNASICNIPDELPNYKYGGWTDFVQETDYYGKKWAPILAQTGDAEHPYRSFDAIMYNFTAQRDNMQLWNIHDLVILRFADVLLMQSELKGEASGMNKVRARAGLPAVAYSLPALQNERRWELSCEGVRWNDIRRWHIAADALDKQEGVDVYYQGVKEKNHTSKNGGGYKARYNATRGFFPIPKSEIDLSNGAWKQNAGWDASTEFSGWK